MAVRQAMASAERHYAEGRLRQAALICCAILRAAPDHFNAVSLLGIVLCRSGHLHQGRRFFRRALDIRPNDAPTLDRLGDVLYVQGDLAGAIALYEQAIGISPDFVAVHCKIGIALQDQGKTKEAIAAYRRAIDVNSNSPKPYFNLGVSLRRDGKFQEAAACYARAIALKPYYPEAFLNLGNVLMDMGRFPDAALAYRHAASCGPEARSTAPCDQPSSQLRAHAWTNLGIALKKNGQFDAAIDAHRQAIALAPDYAIAHNNLGVLLQDRGCWAEAIAAHQEAVRLDPNFGTAYSNLGVALKEQGLIHQSIGAHRQAVAAEPDHPKVHFNLAAALLMAGEFEEGFSEYEWRWKGAVPGLKDRNFSQPQWDGKALGERTLLLHAEQGFGDTLQFVRFAGEISKEHGKIVLEAPQTLLDIVRTAPGIDVVVATGSELPKFDVHIPLMSLPHVLRIQSNTIPAPIPYLAADFQRAESWRHRLDRGTDLKVGIVWAGNRRHTHDHHRSIPIDALLPALNMRGVHLFSLQKEIRPGDREALDLFTDRMTDLSFSLRDFAETAAIMSALDLVISVDTAVAHLAGALGRPVWTMLPFALDWRWMLDRKDSPWYPTMRLFRQPRPGDWTSVIARVQIELTSLLIGRDGSSLRASA